MGGSPGAERVMHGHARDPRDRGPSPDEPTGTGSMGLDGATKPAWSHPQVPDCDHERWAMRRTEAAGGSGVGERNGLRLWEAAASAR
jgi:hypothetical protein